MLCGKLETQEWLYHQLDEAVRDTRGESKIQLSLQAQATASKDTLKRDKAVAEEELSNAKKHERA